MKEYSTDRMRELLSQDEMSAVNSLMFDNGTIEERQQVCSLFLQEREKTRDWGQKLFSKSSVRSPVKGMCLPEDQFTLLAYMPANWKLSKNVSSSVRVVIQDKGPLTIFIDENQNVYRIMFMELATGKTWQSRPLRQVSMEQLLYTPLFEILYNVTAGPWKEEKAIKEYVICTMSDKKYGETREAKVPYLGSFFIKNGGFFGTQVFFNDINSSKPSIKSHLPSGISVEEALEMTPSHILEIMEKRPNGDSGDLKLKDFYSLPKTSHLFNDLLVETKRIAIEGFGEFLIERGESSRRLAYLVIQYLDTTTHKVLRVQVRVDMSIETIIEMTPNQLIEALKEQNNFINKVRSYPGFQVTENEKVLKDYATIEKSHMGSSTVYSENITIDVPDCGSFYIEIDRAVKDSHFRISFVDKKGDLSVFSGNEAKEMDEILNMAPADLRDRVYLQSWAISERKGAPKVSVKNSPFISREDLIEKSNGSLKEIISKLNETVISPEELQRLDFSQKRGESKKSLVDYSENGYETVTTGLGGTYKDRYEKFSAKVPGVGTFFLQSGYTHGRRNGAATVLKFVPPQGPGALVLLDWELSLESLIGRSPEKIRGFIIYHPRMTEIARPKRPLLEYLERGVQDIHTKIVKGNLIKVAEITVPDFGVFHIETMENESERLPSMYASFVSIANSSSRPSPSVRCVSRQDVSIERILQKTPAEVLRAMKRLERDPRDVWKIPNIK